MNLVVAPGYSPFDKQSEFHRCPKRFKVATGGNRSGKTMSGGAEFCANVFRDIRDKKGKPAVRAGGLRVPRLAYWVVTPTHELGEYPRREVLRFLPYELIESTNASTGEIWLKGDVQIQFKSTERAERLVAASLNGLWMDEAPRCKGEAWKGGLRARLADQLGWALFTGSPLGGRQSWVFQELVSRAGIDEHVAAFSWTTEDNPYVPREEIDHARRTLPEAWFKRDWLASWDAFGGAIYEEFCDAHITNEKRFRAEMGIPEYRHTREFFSKVVGAIDFGFAAAGAIVVVGEYGDGKWAVLDEVYGPGMRPTGTKDNYLDHCKRLAEKWGVRDWIADPEDSGAIFDLRNNGLSVRPAHKNVYTGIRRVATALHRGLAEGRPGFRVFDNCRNLIAEMRNYQWKPTRDQSGFLEEPADGQQDHALDALRYAAMELRLYDYVERARSPGGYARPLG